jgi:hypothetical protein
MSLIMTTHSYGRKIFARKIFDSGALFSQKRVYFFAFRTLFGTLF